MMYWKKSRAGKRKEGKYMDAKKGQWVKIHGTVLEAGKRAPNIPEDTQNVDLEVWHKGFLQDDQANLGDKVTVKTYIGREVEGNLVEVEPHYDHSFGKYVEELSYIGLQIRELLEEEEN